VHHAGLLHRDLKPSNILLREDGSPLLTDFGLARDLRSDADTEPSTGFSGTRAFASPEQRRGEPLDVRSDVYSLGVTLRHILIDPIPADLGAIIAKATSPAITDRYTSAADFADDLERFLADKPVRASPPSLLRRAVMFVRRNRHASLGTTLGAACALALAAACVVAIFIAPLQAEKHLTRARLEMLSPAHANNLWNVEWFGVTAESQYFRFSLEQSAFDRAAAEYLAALRWRPWGEWSRSVRRELDVVVGQPPRSGDDRLAGLAAYLSGNAQGAIEAWSRLAAREDPDAFIDAALGVVYLIREQHPLAYPRLEHACKVFPRVGFLTVYHADAAIGCGDLDRAERLLAESELFDNQDNHHSTLRVRGDLLLARGQLDDAFRAFINATVERQTIADTHRDAPSPSAAHALILEATIASPIGATRIARIRAARGDLDGAASAMGRAFDRCRCPDAAREQFTRYVDRWWTSLPETARHHAVRRAIDLPLHDPESLVFRLRHAHAATLERQAHLGHRDNTSPMGKEPSWRIVLDCLLEDFVALAAPDSHSSLERAPLGELARRLEVWNMERWNTIAQYSTTLKNRQFAAWQSPLPRTASELLARLHRSAARKPPPPAPEPGAIQTRDASPPG